MFNTSIKSLVTKTLEKVIKEKQLQYDAECKNIDIDCVQAVDRLITEAETKKSILKEDLVESIVGKFR